MEQVLKYFRASRNYTIYALLRGSGHYALEDDVLLIDPKDLDAWRNLEAIRPFSGLSLLLLIATILTGQEDTIAHRMYIPAFANGNKSPREVLLENLFGPFHLGEFILTMKLCYLVGQRKPMWEVAYTQP